MDCPYCDTIIKAHQYDDHVDTCGSRTDVCDKCLQRFMLKYLEDHVRNCNSQTAELPRLPTPPPIGTYSNDRRSPSPRYEAPPIAVPLNLPRLADRDIMRPHVRDPGIPVVGLPFNPLVPRPDLSTPEDDGNGRPANPTIVLDPNWVGSIAEAMGVDDSELDRIVAGNINAYQQISQNALGHRERDHELEQGTSFLDYTSYMCSCIVQ